MDLYINSFLDAPDTAIIASLSVMNAIWPEDLYKESLYIWAKSSSPTKGEYFRKIIPESLSIKISNGSPSRILRFLRIDIGTTTRPR